MLTEKVKIKFHKNIYTSRHRVTGALLKIKLLLIALALQVLSRLQQLLL